MSEEKRIPFALFKDNNDRFIYIDTLDWSSETTRVFIGRPGAMQEIKVNNIDSAGMNQSFVLESGAVIDIGRGSATINRSALTILDVTDNALIETLGIDKPAIQESVAVVSTAGQISLIEEGRTPFGLYKDPNGRFIYIDTIDWNYDTTRVFIGRPGAMQEIKVNNVSSRGMYHKFALENGASIDVRHDSATMGSGALTTLDKTDSALIETLGIDKPAIQESVAVVSTAGQISLIEEGRTPFGLYKDPNGRFIYIDTIDWNYDTTRIFMGRPGAMQEIKVKQVFSAGMSHDFVLEDGPAIKTERGKATLGYHMELVVLDPTDVDLVKSLGAPKPPASGGTSAPRPPQP